MCSASSTRAIAWRRSRKLAASRSGYETSAWSDRPTPIAPLDMQAGMRWRALILTLSRISASTSALNRQPNSRKLVDSFAERPRSRGAALPERRTDQPRDCGSTFHHRGNHEGSSPPHFPKARCPQPHGGRRESSRYRLVVIVRVAHEMQALAERNFR